MSASAWSEGAENTSITQSITQEKEPLNMHPSSLEIMQRLLKQFTPENPLNDGGLVDVGSYNVNGTYREIALEVPGIHRYTGIDIRKGPNVDFVIPPEGDWKSVTGSYDIVISGQCLEHVAAPWDWIKQVKSICNPGGLIVIIAPWRHDYHPYPIDAWRVFPEGMRALLESAFLKVKDAGFDRRGEDCWGVAVNCV